jgi:uncharacterized protein involved in tolerance to divalent cations
MKPIYEEVRTERGLVCIKASYDDGRILLIPIEESNSDYQAYLRWLNGEEENGTIS